ncbi:cupin domain-containing protein [Aestuariivivens sediminis]|uniref:cupin domain-containing protein n=1 Tax=Aestuariivivens sediminis TaxID=2913557 RepID=UPI001F5A018E|nr:cupin domain-containing protein [Aestuariivivens sediminis]
MKRIYFMLGRDRFTFKMITVIFGLLFMGSFYSSHAQKKEASINTTLKYNIENCVNQINFSDTVKTKVGYQYWFVNKSFIDGRTLKLSVVEPGKATHAPHIHYEDEFFFVLEGTAAFYLNGDTKIVGPYTSLYCPSGYEHGIKNVGVTELKYLVIKKYILE